MPRFGSRQKSPQEVVKLLKEALLVLSRSDNKDDKRHQRVRYFVDFFTIIFKVDVCVSL
jgi:hypothetical protein